MHELKWCYIVISVLFSVIVQSIYRREMCTEMFLFVKKLGKIAYILGGSIAVCLLWYYMLVYITAVCYIYYICS